ncbi:methyl-accepting chemotaxis protein [Pararhizobium capsulatum DSM 1112]|uniref:Methyl-accepting chemotaxis protein n=1 Tax=Pararhizobium capsulatum DSM 1112 TaxID=1121113 RepID=A0ABU0BXW5_9HYPH|nr:methyl-accepting chemotaxis protein [Pararhizobium capsulatum]MDQ0323095.1 methyl-accepting chemotaxis protein [Pararhizobium capsulatum DSM 1112]
MSRPKIKTALTSVLALVACVFVMFACFAINSMNTVNNNVAELAMGWLPGIAISNEMNIALSTMRRDYLNHIMALDDASRGEAESAINSGASHFLAELAKNEELSHNDAERAAANDIRTKFSALQQLSAPMLALSQAGKFNDAKIYQQTRVRPAASELTEAIDQIVKIKFAGAGESYETSKWVFRRTMSLTLIAVAIGLAIIAGGVYFSRRGIAMPIEAITVSMKALATGNTETPIPYEGRADEIGDMAAAVAVFKANALETTMLETQAARERALAEKEREQNADSQRVKAEEMRLATDGLALGLSHLAKGNLSFQLTSDFAPDFEALRDNFNASALQLADTLQSVAAAASSIDSGSREISRSSNDLSGRTEHQAASLEETAAALDQITTNVSNSSQRAEEARQIAGQANASAMQSSLVVANAINAMERIEQSSRQISNIISVIDEIAFQTNLLALNAGVEAARAGEAGKGFAVVAQEVRELAQRSALAAKEIKDLIRNSSIEVEGGVKFVRDTGDALNVIGDYVGAINQHMESIAVSAREQSIGLVEVNSAVNQMDQVTQQNAAMVEEMNAASATLAQESNRLKALTSQFVFTRLDESRRALSGLRAA